MGNCCIITHTQRSTLIITINKVHFEDSNYCTTLLVYSRHFDNSNNVVVVGRTWGMCIQAIESVGSEVDTDMCMCV